MKTNRIRKPIAKAVAQLAIAEMRASRPRIAGMAPPVAIMRSVFFSVSQHERRAGDVERGKGQEVGRDAERIGDRRRHDAAEEIAGDIAGDIGGQRAGRLGGREMLGEIGDGQRERGRHAQALRDAQQGEDR